MAKHLLRPFFFRKSCRNTPAGPIYYVYRSVSSGNQDMASMRLGPALRQIQRLLGDGTVVGVSDVELWERFATQGDSLAFEALVERHGPMVLAVCRGVLNDSNDAEDIFQATFLVLLRKASKMWAVKGSLGSWLYRVALRMAIHANADGARRSSVERRAREMVKPQSGYEDFGDDVLQTLHEEIGRLPDKYRAPIVLCHLEQLTHAEAARQLGWTVDTVRGRVAKARELLRVRLTRRGLALSGGVLVALFSEQAALAVVPRAWIDVTACTATKLASGCAAGVVSATAIAFSERMLRRMFMTRLICAAAALLAVGGAACMAIAVAAGLKNDGKPPNSPPNVPDSRANAATAKAEKATKPIPIVGRVLDWAGKPVPRATVYVRHSHWGELGQENRAVEVVARAGPDGQFRFELDPAKSDVATRDGPAWHSALVAAIAPGHGPAWISAEIAARGSAELRLVPEDQPIHGRILDSQGRAVSEANVRAKRIALARADVDLDALLASGKLDFDGIRVPTIQSDNWQSPVWIGRAGEVKTDAAGRFEIKGLGRDQLAVLEIESRGMERANIAVLNRTPRVPSIPASKPAPTFDPVNGEIGLALHGATFEYVVGPSKPISGVVKLQGTGRPVAGVTVAGQIPGRVWSVVMTTADNEGRYLLEGLPKAAAYSLSVRPKPGSAYLGARKIVTDTAGLQPIDVAFDLGRAVGVTGRLIDKQTGHDVECDQVVYSPLPSNGNQQVGYGYYSPTDNTFRVTVSRGGGMIAVKVRGKSHPYPGARLAPADKGKMVVQGEDGATFGFPLSVYNAYRFVEFPEGVESATVNLEVVPGISRKVELVGPDGRPVSGAIAMGLTNDPFASAVIDGATFEVNGLLPDESRRVEIRHEGEGLAGSATVAGADANARSLIVKLAPCGIIAGRLIDEDDQPLRGAKVSAGIDRGRLASNPAFRDREAVTDRQGRFRIPGINPTLSARIWIQDPNHPLPKYASKPEKDLGGLTVKPGAVLDLSDIRVRFNPLQ
jgi:RNA polymerase sigma factor (sigma-70 family)